jgi:hypothetical protein
MFESTWQIGFSKAIGRRNVSCTSLAEGRGSHKKREPPVTSLSIALIDFSRHPPFRSVRYE